MFEKVISFAQNVQQQSDRVTFYLMEQEFNFLFSNKERILPKK